MMNCPKCNAKLPASANYCDQCGYEFEHAASHPTSSGGYSPMPDSRPKGTPAGSVPVGRTLMGVITRPFGIPVGTRTPGRGKSGSDWMHRLMTKCIVVTVATLAVAVAILLFNPWPGCLISASLLLYAIAGTAGSIAIQLPDVGDNLDRDMGADKAFHLLDHIVNLTVIWELFWLAAGLVCLIFPWWAVLIAEIVNLSVLMMLIGGIIDEM